MLGLCFKFGCLKKKFEVICFVKRKQCYYFNQSINPNVFAAHQTCASKHDHLSTNPFIIKNRHPPT